MTEIAVHWPLRPRAMEALARLGRLHRLDLAPDPDAALAATAAARVLVTGGERPAGAALFDRLPALGLVATMSVGTDAIDLSAARSRGIAVTNTPGVLTEDVADAALMLVLATARRLLAGDAWVRGGAWATKGAMPLTRSLTGKRAGLLGYGRIGQAVGRRLRAIGTEIAYCTRKPVPGADATHVADPVALAAWADVLVVTVPGGEATRGIVSAEVIGALGPAGILVNVARGTVVDEPALVAALSEGRLGGAGLDVFLNEPRPDPRFASLPNVVLYPHHASGTEETRDAMADLVVQNVAAFLDGRPLLTPVA